MDLAPGASPLGRRPAHGAAGWASIGRLLFFRVFLGKPRTHEPLEVRILRGPLTDIRAAEPSYLGSAARRTGRVPITEWASRSNTAEILTFEGFSRCSRRHRFLRRSRCTLGLFARFRHDGSPLVHEPRFLCIKLMLGKQNSGFMQKKMQLLCPRP